MKARSRRARSSSDLAGAAPLFAALGDATRLTLVVRLGTGPQSIARLAADTPLTRQAITKHLEVLSAAGLVRSDRRGRERIWNLEADRLDAARHYLDQVSAQWDAALGRLQQRVEE